MKREEQAKFTSQKIAEEIKKKFAQQAEIISINIKYKRNIGRFIRKIERAHKKAAKSTLSFS